MASQIQFTKSTLQPTNSRLFSRHLPCFRHNTPTSLNFGNNFNNNHHAKLRLFVYAADRNSSSGTNSKGSENSNINNNINKKGSGSGSGPGGSSVSASTALSNSNYVVPMDNSSCITRPLGEILRDLNKRIPDNIIKIRNHGYDSTFIPWYQANRMLSFHAPGWCGEIRDVIFSDNGSVTVVYRVTIRGSDGEAYRESTGTVSPADGQVVDPVAAAEEIAFCRACARFGLGLYLYHEE